MKLNGVDALIKQLDRMERDIDDDVDEILKKNANEFSSTAKVTAREVMIKGYWTGNLAAQISPSNTGRLKYTVDSNAHYSGFVEYGTRFMEAEPYFLPTYQAQSKQLKIDLERLING